MRPAKLLDIAHDAGVGVYVEGGQLRLVYRPDADVVVLDQLRSAKAEIVEHLRAGHMPAGYGRCPCCAEFGWLPAGPDDGVCSSCALLLDDEAEVTLRGEMP